MFLPAVVLGLATTTAQPVPPCKNLTVQEVSELPAAQRLEITACALRVAASVINAEQSKRQDGRMTMRADVEGMTLRFTYRLALDARQVPQARLTAMLPMLKNQLCAGSLAQIAMSNGASYRYVFKDRSGQIIRDVRITSC